jgi:hypothetical protein
VTVQLQDGGTLTIPGAEPEVRDWHQEHKDDVAMGLIDRDGNPMDPPEPDGDEGW